MSIKVLLHPTVLLRHCGMLLNNNQLLCGDNYYSFIANQISVDIPTVVYQQRPSDFETSLTELEIFITFAEE